VHPCTCGIPPISGHAPFSYILVLHGIRPSMAKKKAAGYSPVAFLGILLKDLD